MFYQNDFLCSLSSGLWSLQGKKKNCPLKIKDLSIQMWFNMNVFLSSASNFCPIGMSSDVNTNPRVNNGWF